MGTCSLHHVTMYHVHGHMFSFMVDWEAFRPAFPCCGIQGYRHVLAWCGVEELVMQARPGPNGNRLDER